MACSPPASSLNDTASASTSLSTSTTTSTHPTRHQPHGTAPDAASPAHTFTIEQLLAPFLAEGDLPEAALALSRCSQAASVDPNLLKHNLEALAAALPKRSIGSLLARCPTLAAAPQLGAWIEFLRAFGFQRLAVSELILSNPDVVMHASIYQAGQVFTALKQLGLANEQIVGPIFRWRALLGQPPPAGSGNDNPPQPQPEGLLAVGAFLERDLGLPPEAVVRACLDYPALLARDVEGDLRPKLSMLQGLDLSAVGGPASLRGVLWEEWCGWAHGLANWQLSVAPKLALLEGLMGSEAEASALLAASPLLLRLPLSGRLAPVLKYLQEELGLDQGQMGELLRRCPQVAAMPAEELEAKATFLLEVVNVDIQQLLEYPRALTASLSACIGPRFFFLNQAGLSQHFRPPPPSPGPGASASERIREGDSGGSSSGSGVIDLRALLEPAADGEWLEALQARCGRNPVLLQGEWDECRMEWNEVIGWCAMQAFTRKGRRARKYEDALSLFSLLIT